MMARGTSGVKKFKKRGCSTGNVKEINQQHLPTVDFCFFSFFLGGCFLSQRWQEAQLHNEGRARSTSSTMVLHHLGKKPCFNALSFDRDPFSKKLYRRDRRITHVWYEGFVGGGKGEKEKVEGKGLRSMFSMRKKENEGKEREGGREGGGDSESPILLFSHPLILGKVERKNGFC